MDDWAKAPKVESWETELFGRGCWRIARAQGQNRFPRPKERISRWMWTLTVYAVRIPPFRYGSVLRGQTITRLL